MLNEPVLMNLAIPGIWAAGYGLARRSADEHSAPLLSVGFAIALWLLCVHVVGLTSHSFLIGVRIGTWGVSIVGLIDWFLRPRQRDPSPNSARLVRHWRLAGLALVTSTALITPAVIGWNFHDELLFTGHMSIAEQMRHDVYPPRHLTFPEFELRYHYGFNVLVAAMTVLWQVRVDTAIDIATLLCWAYTWCLLWALGERLLGPGRGTLTAAVTLLGGGLPFLCPRTVGVPHYSLLGLCHVDGALLNPPMVSYFFQHPWTLGLPIGMCAMFLIIEPARSVWRRTGLGVLLVALSITQYVLFLSVTAAAVAEILSEWPPRLKHVAAVLLMIVSVLLAASQLHGFFLPAPDHSGFGISYNLGICHTLTGTLLWHGFTYGLLLPLGLSGFFFLREGRAFLALLVIGGIGVMNLFSYVHSWDIVKFGNVAALALSISASAAVARIFALRPKLLGRLVGSALLAGLMAEGLVFPLVFALKFSGIPEGIYHRETPRLSAEDIEVVEWLQTHARPDEIVYRKSGVSQGYAVLGGIPQAWFDGMVATFGFSPERLNARARLLAEKPTAPEAYLKQGIHWLVLDPGDDRLNALSSTWIDQGKARLEKRIDHLRIIRLLSP